jgi:hypothetical protein
VATAAGPSPAALSTAPTISMVLPTLVGPLNLRLKALDQLTCSHVLAAMLSSESLQIQPLKQRNSTILCDVVASEPDP